MPTDSAQMDMIAAHVQTALESADLERTRTCLTPASPGERRATRIRAAGVGTGQHEPAVPHPQVTQTTEGPTGAAPTPTRPACTSGTVDVRNQPGEGLTATCVTVGSTIVLTGSDAMSGGTWPRPPKVSNKQAVTLVASHSSGTTFMATLRAVATRATTVDVPFIARLDVCNPTPCTPVPGAPLVWQVTVVG